MKIADMIDESGQVRFGGLVWGQVIWQNNPHGPGWKFIPRVAGRKGSRKVYATREEAVPQWVRRQIKATAKVAHVIQ